MMKKTIIRSTLGLCMASIVLSSCDNDDNNTDWSIIYPNALVTVKSEDNGTPYLQLDDKTTLLPANLPKNLYDGKQVRALTNFNIIDRPSGSHDKSVYVNWIDSIRTKPTVPTLKNENDATYGNDPVEIVKDWVTIVEDGYLTLRFRTVWGIPGIAHHVNLLTGTNPDNPYEVELRHNAKGDVNGVAKDALIAFSLDQLPGTNGETVKLTLKWNSFSGTKSLEFDYCSNTSSGEITLPKERITTTVK